MINWEVIGWTCITIAFLAGIFALVIAIISAKNLRSRRGELKDLHVDIKPGMKIMFCGGVYGKLVRVGDETVDVEVAKNVVITVSRFAIQGTV